MTNLTKIVANGALLTALSAAALPASAETRITSACPALNATAVMTSRVPAEMPPIAALAGLSGSSTVQVDLDDRGVAHNVAIFASSGSNVLDRAARQAALVQTYSPEVRDCARVAGSYRVVVVFASNNAE